MRTPRCVLVVVVGVLMAIPLGLTTAAPRTDNNARPVLVSPGTTSGSSVIAERCPTFLWAAVDRARAYELVIYRVPSSELPADRGPLEPVAQLSLPGRANGWTPGLDKCLQRGGRYAWSLGAVDKRGHMSWSEASFFEVSTAPADREVEAAIEVLLAYLDNRGAPSGRVGRKRHGEGALVAESPQAMRESLSAIDALEQVDRSSADDLPNLDRVGLTRPPSRGVESTAPTLGDASLTLDGDIHLESVSSVFKGGEVFLWDDVDGNTGLGQRALAANTLGSSNTAVGARALANNESGRSNTAVGSTALMSNTTGYWNTAVGRGSLESSEDGYFNTAVGASALGSNLSHRNTAVGSGALLFNTSGNSNSALGDGALHSNTTGRYNTAVGNSTLFNNPQGEYNVALGVFALNQSTSGSYNTALGSRALSQVTIGSHNLAIGDSAGTGISRGSHNLLIGHIGDPADRGTIRIGSDSQTRAFIAGVRGVTTGVADAVPVMIDSEGQLGTVSSSRRFKEQIRDMGETSTGLLELRPVTFRYKRDSSPKGEAEQPVRYGLIAEEVAEVYPELVVYSQDGQAETVLYHVLSSMLLNEIQKLHREIEEMK